MALSPQDELRKAFEFTLELAIRDVLRKAGTRKQATDLQVRVWAHQMADDILRSNWKVRRGPPLGGFGGAGTFDHNTAELG